MNILYRVRSLSAFSLETFTGRVLKMIGNGPPWSDHDLTHGRSTADCSLLHGPLSWRTQACRAGRALPPPLGGRTTSLLAPRAGSACSASLSTLHALRLAGSPSRAASNLQATRCLARLRGLPRNWRKPTTRAHVPHACRSSFYDVRIDFVHAAVSIRTIRWTRRQRAPASPIQTSSGKDQG